MLIQPTNQTPTLYSTPAFRSVRVLQHTKPGTDSFVRLKNAPVFVAVSDVKAFLEQNKFKVLLGNGEIFNRPVTDNGDSLLMNFLRITPFEDEIDDYNKIISQMSKMRGIDYNQKDSGSIPALEWIILHENPELLKLVKGKKLDTSNISPALYKLRVVPVPS